MKHARLAVPRRRPAARRRSPPEVKVIFVDFHAEATSEKQALGFYLDGRVERRARHPHPRAHRRRADPAQAAPPS